MSENRQLGSWSRNLSINGWHPINIPGSFGLSLQVIAWFHSSGIDASHDSEHPAVREHSDRQLLQNCLRGSKGVDGSRLTICGCVLDDSHIVPTNRISRPLSRSRDSSLIWRYTRQNGEADNSSHNVQIAIGAITWSTIHPTIVPVRGREE
jgi:hypothetical protein